MDDINSKNEAQSTKKTSPLQRTEELFTAVTNLPDMEDSPNEEILDQTDQTRIPDVTDRAWFSKLVALIFGFALIIIGDFLYKFPARPINLISLWSTDELADVYIVRIVGAKRSIICSEAPTLTILHEPKTSTFRGALVYLDCDPCVWTSGVRLVRAPH
ncbi:MAG: hypothetical protein Q9170_002174 [Blastenia crenularia]